MGDGNDGDAFDPSEVPNFALPAGIRLRRTRAVLSRLMRPQLDQQVLFDRQMLERLRHVDSVVQELRGTAEELRATTARLDERLSAVERTAAAHGTALAGLSPVGGQLSDLDGGVRAVQEAMAHHHSVLERQDVALERHEDAVQRFDSLLVPRLEQLELEAARLAALAELVQQQSLTRLREVVGPLQSEMNALTLDVERAKLVQSTTWPRLAQLELFVEQIKRSGTVQVERPAPPDEDSQAAAARSLEFLYPALEEAFRGPFEMIKERLVMYADELALAGKLGPIVDVASGRGEMLALMRELGVQAYGVESGRQLVERSRERGLEVVHGDALEHLASVAPMSLGAVTAIHLVERMDMASQIALIDLALLALAPGGVLILETANPENLTVGASSFYADPRHRRPLLPEVLAFMVSARGFGDIDVRRLRRDGDYQSHDGHRFAEADARMARVAELVERWLLAPEDFAIVGRRPG